KVSQSLPPMAANKVKTVFCRGAPQGGLSCRYGAIHLLYLAENTSQAASVEFVPQSGDKLCAQLTCKSLSESPEGGFRQPVMPARKVRAFVMSETQPLRTSIKRFS